MIAVHFLLFVCFCLVVDSQRNTVDSSIGKSSSKGGYPGVPGSRNRGRGPLKGVVLVFNWLNLVVPEVISSFSVGAPGGAGLSGGRGRGRGR